jgi:hypothetical protein
MEGEMEKQTHTPGPWFVDEQGAPTIRKADGSVICGVPSNYDDARLIAAAPELLAALKMAGDTLRKPGVVSYEDRIAALALIDAAIAKAEGR